MHIHRLSAKIIRDAIATGKPFELDAFKKTVESNLKIDDWWNSGPRKSPPKALVGVLLFQAKAKSIEAIALPRSFNALRDSQEELSELAEAIDWWLGGMESVEAIAYIRLFDTSNKCWEPAIYSEIQTQEWRTTKWWTSEGLVESKRENMLAVYSRHRQFPALVRDCLDFFDPHGDSV